MHSEERLPIFNFLRLSERITTSGMPLKEEIPFIGDLGGDLIITLVPEGVGSDLPGEAGLVYTAGLRFVRIPVYWEKPGLDNFISFCRIMEENIDQKMHIHCEANMRVSVFMALYRIIVNVWPQEKAMAPVAEIWKPNKTWQAFILKVRSQRDRILQSL